MHIYKKHVENIILFSSIWLILSFLFALILAPYNEIISNQYLNYGMYFSILVLFQKTLNLWMILIYISLLLSFLIVTLIRFRRFASNLINLLIGLFLFFALLEVTGYNLNMVLDKGILKITIILTVLFALLRLAPDIITIPPKKIVIVLFVFCIILIGTLNTVLFVNQKNKGPNVVLIVVDTLRADRTSITDFKIETTPYLKKYFMPDAVSFTNAYSNSSWTLPSVTSLMTSRYPSKININGYLSKLEKSHLTLAEILQNRGYTTGGIVSHLFLIDKFGLAQGFNYYNQTHIDLTNQNHDSITSPQITGDAITFIRENKTSKFFLFLHYFDPHYNFKDHAQSSTYKGPFKDIDIHELRGLIQKKFYYKHDLDYLKYCYDSEIRFTDSYIGKVIEALKKNNIYDNTIIIFTADHGEEFAERGYVGHTRTLYNELINIPLMIKPSSGTAFPVETAYESENVSNLDIVPTTLNLLNIKHPGKFQGKNIFDRDNKDNVVFSEVNVVDHSNKLYNKVCMIDGNWKLIKDIPSDKFELYNLQDDPYESHDRSVNDVDDVLYRMKENLENWLRVNRKNETEKTDVHLNKKEIQNLKSLGYLK